MNNMNSEKVKEIKKVLECCINDCSGNSCPYDKYEKGLKCIEDLQKDCLTIINELESENERLDKSDTSKEESSNMYYNLYKDLKRKNKDLNELCELQRVSIAESFVRENQLKDRIAELENQMCRNEDLHNATEKLNDIIILKQFAEKLKEKAKCLKLGSVEIHNFLFTTEIDETLKEYV